MPTTYDGYEFLLPAAAGVVALICLAFAWRAGRRRRLVECLPTCKTSGVFIGLVELKGTAETARPLVSYLAEVPCVQYAWTIAEEWSRTVTETYTDSQGHTQTRTRHESGWTNVGGGVYTGRDMIDVSRFVSAIGFLAVPPVIQIGMLATARRSDELVTAVRFPTRKPGAGYAFTEMTQRHGDFAICAVAAVVSGNSTSLGVGGVADKPTVREWSGLADGQIDDALNDFAWDLGGTDDLHAPADYRRELVRRLGAHVTVESEVGVGTRALVELNRVEQPPRAPIPSPFRPAISSQRLLLIDDEPTVVPSLRRLLEQRYRVEVAPGVDEGLCRLEAGGFDIVLCDVMMPAGGGERLYSTLLTTHPSLARRVIFLTGGAVTEGTRLFLKEQPQPVLDKPLVLEELARAVEALAEDELSANLH